MKININPAILMSVDVEDWFQVENLREQILPIMWHEQEYRVEHSTEKLIDIFNQYHIKGTFFILGWIAERFKGLIRTIVNTGHEIASHGYNHQINYHLDNDTLFNDLISSKNLLEDIIGESVIGYRAPSFSINEDILGIIAKAGYLYDSSLNTSQLHDRYGFLTSYNYDKPHDLIETNYGRIMEIPVSNIRVNRYFFPWSGGGYFRIIPFPLFYRGVRFILNKSGSYAMYLHPWELDNEQPKVKNLRWSYKFRHYVNLNKTKDKLHLFFQIFNKNNFITYRDYFLNNRN